MLGWIEKLLGGWLTKQLDRLVDWIWKKARSWFRGKAHLTEVEKYVKAIDLITAKAKAEAEQSEDGRVSEATQAELAQMLERRNRGIKFDDSWMQDYPWD